jgi:flagellar hook-associated protein 1 FlgK
LFSYTRFGEHAPPLVSKPHTRISANDQCRLVWLAENFVSIAPTDPLAYYNSGNTLDPKIGSNEANSAQLKSSFLGNVVADLVNDVGVQVATWKNTQKANDTVLANLKDQRDQLSGVNLDEEAANLLKYQQLYSASTKILQTGNQMFNTLLAIMN